MDTAHERRGRSLRKWLRPRRLHASGAILVLLTLKPYEPTRLGCLSCILASLDSPCKVFARPYFGVVEPAGSVRCLDVREGRTDSAMDTLVRPSAKDVHQLLTKKVAYVSGK